VADFGIARFTEDQLHTLVETTAASRLANFQYAAPEQRVPGQQVGQPADIYALGLMLNELFTGAVPHGTEYRRIENVAEKYGFLDAVVAQMIRQAPNERPGSIAEIKGLIQRHQADAVSLQKIDELKKVVVPEGEVTDPLAFEPPRVVGADYQNGTLRLKLDRPVTNDWVRALVNMGSYRAPMNAPPHAFQFNGADVSVQISDHEAQFAIDCLN
jgi:hypothetical protein